MNRFIKIAVSTALVTAMLLVGVIPAFAAVKVSTASLSKEYDNGSYVMKYRIIIPEDYDAKKEYPVLVFLHGAGERGDDNTSQLKNMIQILYNRQSADISQMIVIMPQCPAGKQWVNTPWANGNYNSTKIMESKELKSVMGILEKTRGEYSVNDDMIYCLGLSMGGFGTWDLLTRHSDVFAAGVPLCGGGDPSKADVLKDVPIWTFHGGKDPTVPVAGTREMNSAITAAGGTKINYNELAAYEHGIWDLVAANYKVINWLLQQKLSDRTEKSALAYAGVQDKVGSEGKTALRVIGVVDSLDYSLVGFDVHTDSDNSYSTDVVYSEVTGSARYYSASRLGGNYAFAVEGIEIPSTGTVTVTVTPFKIRDGVKSYGESATFTYTDGIFTSTAG